MIRRLLLTTASAVMLMALSSVARADTVTVVGNATPTLATATVNCSFNAQTNTFTFTITNTSLHDARITGIGFDLQPGGSGSGLNGFSGNVTFQPAGVDFAFSDGNLGNVPQFGSAVLDFGFVTGSNFTGGDPNDGLPPGIAPNNQATFVVSGASFSGMTEEQICNAIFVRFQRVGADGEGSDVGTPSDAHTPEPVTMLLLGTGLAGVAARVRRKRRKE
ncbi:MAG TPA: PEP-CTERM sorting domain-containing protein [Pyrinomonadaceae bacterium]